MKPSKAGPVKLKKPRFGDIITPDRVKFFRYGRLILDLGEIGENHEKMWAKLDRYMKVHGEFPTVWFVDKESATQLKPKSSTKKSISMYYRQQGDYTMADINDFSDIFKSDTEVHDCPECGTGLVISSSDEGTEIQKAMKGKKRKGTAKKIGNEMSPHEGKASGSVAHPQAGVGGKMGSAQRTGTQPSNHTVKSEEAPLFAFRKSFAAVAYDTVMDAELAKSIELNGQAGYIPSSRNLEMEREAVVKADSAE